MGGEVKVTQTLPEEEWVQIDTRFSEPVEDMPPQRKLWNIQYEGWSNDLSRPYSFRIAKVDMQFLRDDFAEHYPRDMPRPLGNKPYQQYWVHSMWEAMYNPLHLRRVVAEDFENHPREHKRKNPPTLTYQILHGHHRMRLLDALGADYIYTYVVTGHHHAGEHPAWIKERNKYNGVVPRRGTRSTTCGQCGEPVRVSSRKRNDFNIPRWYNCPHCEYYEDYQPYPERI